MTLYEWAIRWNVRPEAVSELQRIVFNHEPPASTEPPNERMGGEAGAMIVVRQEAASKGLRVWRNNVGAFQDASDRWVRFGLANDSAAVNARIKSGDLIGIRPHRVTPDDVGRLIGQFVSREMKAPGWHFTATDRELAQQAWIELVLSLGGDASFATGVGTL